MISQVSYRYFCTLGGISHGRTFTSTVFACGRWITTYYIAD